MLGHYLLDEKGKKMLRLHKISAFVIIILVGRLTSNATTFTENAVISHDDAHFEGTDVAVNGCTLIIDGEHIFKSLKVLHGGIITHSEMFTPVLHLIIEEDAYIDAGSSSFTKSGGGCGGRVAIYAGRDEFYGCVSVDEGDGFEPGQEGSIVRSEYT